MDRVKENRIDFKEYIESKKIDWNVVKAKIVPYLAKENGKTIDEVNEKLSKTFVIPAISFKTMIMEQEDFLYEKQKEFIITFLQESGFRLSDLEKTSLQNLSSEKKRFINFWILGKENHYLDESGKILIETDLEEETNSDTLDMDELNEFFKSPRTGIMSLKINLEDTIKNKDLLLENVTYCMQLLNFIKFARQCGFFRKAMQSENYQELLKKYDDKDKYLATLECVLNSSFYRDFNKKYNSIYERLNNLYEDYISKTYEASQTIEQLEQEDSEIEKRERIRALKRIKEGISKYTVDYPNIKKRIEDANSLDEIKGYQGSIAAFTSDSEEKLKSSSENLVQKIKMNREFFIKYGCNQEFSYEATYDELMDNPQIKQYLPSTEVADSITKFIQTEINKADYNYGSQTSNYSENVELINSLGLISTIPYRPEDAESRGAYTSPELRMNKDGNPELINIIVLPLSIGQKYIDSILAHEFKHADLAYLNEVDLTNRKYKIKCGLNFIEKSLPQDLVGGVQLSQKYVIEDIPAMSLYHPTRKNEEISEAVHELGNLEMITQMHSDNVFMISSPSNFTDDITIYGRMFPLMKEWYERYKTELKISERSQTDINAILEKFGTENFEKLDSLLMEWSRSIDEEKLETIKRKFNELMEHENFSSMEK